MFWSLVIVCLVAIGSCHWIAGLISKQSEAVQNRWASVGGGAGLAYIFIHLLPELTTGGGNISDAIGMEHFLPNAMTESLLFLITMLGVFIPYVLGVIGKQNSNSNKWNSSASLGIFVLVNYLYAYSLPSLLTTGFTYGVLFTVAIAAHVLLADRTLAKDHPLVFRRRFRWAGTAAVIIGGIHAAAFQPISDLTLAVATAYVGGSLLLSVFQEELPDARHSRLGWFTLGLSVMSALLLIATAYGPAVHHS